MARRADVALAVALVAALVGAVAPVPVAASACAPPGGASLPAHEEATGDVVVEGRGWGHGTGMSQYGARGAASSGCTHEQILGTYFPGTTLAQEPTSHRLRVNLQRAAATATIRALEGPIRWEVCFGAGNCSPLPEQTAGEDRRVVVDQTTRGDASDGRFVVERSVSGGWQHVATVGAAGSEDGCPACTQGNYVLRVHLDGRIARIDDGNRDLRYRWGIVEFDSYALGGGWRSFVNLDLPTLEHYLLGLAEMPSSWQEAALESQAIAGRSYARDAYRTRQPGTSRYLACRCHLYATTVDQHYTGYEKEGESTWGVRWVQAVERTLGRVVSYGGRAIPAFFSSSHGGHSESYRFWGGRANSEDVPYLQPVDDSNWESMSGNPRIRWTRTFTFDAVSAAYEHLALGELVRVRTVAPTGAAGRVGAPAQGYGGVELTAASGATATVSGADFRSRMGLFSTLFVAQSPSPPAPPQPNGAVPPPAGATVVVGDWDGDGVDTPGWFRDGRWGLHDRNAADGVTTELAYGQAGDLPVTGDWNGDGRDTIGVVRDGLWLLRYEYRRGADIRLEYGQRGDVPVTGDWNADGRDTIGVVRDGLWLLRYEYRRGADIRLEYGQRGDVPVTGDWNDDGRDTIGVRRVTDWILRSEYRRDAHDVRFRY